MNITIDEASLTETSIYVVYEGEESHFRLTESRKHSMTLTWFYGRSDQEADDLVVGMGQRSNLTLEQVRRTGASAARALLKENKSSAVLIRATNGDGRGSSRISDEEELQAWVEGWMYGLYQFNKHRGVTANLQALSLNLRQEDWQGLSRKELEAIIQTAGIRIEGTQLTRDLVNESPETLNPEAFVAVVEDRFKKAPVQLHVYRGQELHDRQMNGLIAVGAGSKYEPALIEISYNGVDSEKGSPHIVLIGKGVTFDMGGMNVKIGRDISDARMDMGGAAAVVGAMDILVSQKAPVRVTALIAVADNLSGPDAMLPSSVVHYPNGLSVQVANTDGEGRLIIADALLHAANLGADKVIDIATLTGNVGAALGLEIAGIWGDPQITAELVEIGERNGERLWPMPLMDEYESDLRSDYADLKNVGTSTLAGAITAALFIRHFVAASMKWVHIDMAGTVQYKREFPHSAAGATGYGARLLADYVEKQYLHA
ncbi:leucyl aminopeptidase family protein [Paenibacillus lautus]|uniref:leucyl aminopeptidase family protein n=1 Tax=Paenibacillus lautus TaxID=1401 RepID=UPI002DBA8717|nr:leucyl aminopeptidase family protein [Paenibacillus lautus]MEC0202915.1 leucyl aminopeptidase family protein [Paenibacillus lautus]